MILRRFFSRAIREAVALRKHVQRLLSAQKDLLSPQAIAAVQEKINELNAAIAEGATDGKIRIKAEELQFAGEKWIKIYPHAALRENVEVLLVAIAVAMGIRTFFLQPFKIPTASMQPTLYGITSTPDFSNLTGMLRNYGGNFDDLNDEQKSQLRALGAAQMKLQNSITLPTGWQHFTEWLHGYSYIHFAAPEDGSVQVVTPAWPGSIFNLYQRIEFAGKWYTFYFPPDCGEEALEVRSGIALVPGRVYHKGEDVIKLRVHAGDHLFVDRLTYNFRPPERGEIVVFETKGIPADQRNNPPYWTIPDDEFYIKRLVGLSGETISLKQDYDVSGAPGSYGSMVPVGHLVVDGRELSPLTPHFENVYSFSGAKTGTNVLAYHDDEYFGHAMQERLAPGQEVQIAPGNSFMMGDNTLNSLDSRYWGDIPSTSIIGKSFFVYWPLTKRFGLDDE
jgi:signal peptidase I